jgi:predicted cobalt transporter CbtA
VTARNFLIRGLIAGFVAGIVAFLVALSVGEPSVDRAIAIEEAHAAHDASTDGSPNSSTDADHAHEHAVEPVSRSTQKTWGLATGTIAVGTALGGIIALVSAGLIGRFGRFTPGQTTAFAALVGFVAVTLVPFLKYPANPPAVGNPDTIGSRTGLFFGFMLISVIAAVVSLVLAHRVHARSGSYQAVVAGAAAYLLIVVVAALVLPAVDEAGDFPAGTLWSFRIGSLLTLASLWATLGVVLTGLVGRLHRDATADAARREFAASL